MDGLNDGRPVGIRVGIFVDRWLGTAVGATLGYAVGSAVGISVARCEGSKVAGRAHRSRQLSRSLLGPNFIGLRSRELLYRNLDNAYEYKKTSFCGCSVPL